MPHCDISRARRGTTIKKIQVSVLQLQERRICQQQPQMSFEWAPSLCWYGLTASMLDLVLSGSVSGLMTHTSCFNTLCLWFVTQQWGRKYRLTSFSDFSFLFNHNWYKTKRRPRCIDHKRICKGSSSAMGKKRTLADAYGFRPHPASLLNLCRLCIYTCVSS